MGIGNWEERNWELGIGQLPSWEGLGVGCGRCGGVAWVMGHGVYIGQKRWERSPFFSKTVKNPLITNTLPNTQHPTPQTL